ncbi:hypothetical protein GMLC_44190 [Geomonas limicola]|uniref:Probable molybdenum cofactor guanylyltransferase n=1 Tax=Geomonas limicola TaxID=2740186 RepID=A0A6V8NEG9_9BACT|nr:molybdenum cofactor guanylyltransferase [Geomonas limicola]GFO70840.1 hypothetical protein GMLC_44190 [Geomonas limicola]
MPEMWEREVTGVILVGGKSRRMGQDKAFLPVSGRPLFEGVLELFRAQFSRILLVGDREERFADYGLPILADQFPGSSLGGLYTGLSQAPSPYVFVASCDLAYPSAQVLKKICTLREGHDAVVPRTAHGFEPLFALYAKSCLNPIKEQLKRGEFCAYAYYPQLKIRYLAGEELSRLDPAGTAFVNLNTPEEYARIAK